MAKQVGGVVWLPFLVAFIVALITAFSYPELVKKHPKAAGAALYAHKASGIHFVTFIIAFFALITLVGEVPALGGTTALLLLCVFTVVNVAALVLRRDSVGHKHFRAPTILPILGAVACAFLAGP